MRDTVGGVSEGLLNVERRGAVLWWRMTRETAANALSRAMVADLKDAAGGVGPDVRAVVIVGTGKAFCAGADLKERRGFSLEQTRAFLDELGGTLNAIAALRCPVLAALNGVAFGGGLELALACDVRLAAEGVTMGLVETRLGIIPGAGGTQRLARLVGPARAKELIFSGRRFDAADALRWGIVQQVVPPGELEAAAARLADEIAGAGPLAVAEAKAAIDEGLATTLAQGLTIERRHYEVVLTSADRDEGLAAFAEKRAPVFHGK